MIQSQIYADAGNGLGRWGRFDNNAVIAEALFNIAVTESHAGILWQVCAVAQCNRGPLARQLSGRKNPSVLPPWWWL
ncbi:hypothetical protein GCM10011297_01670 [Bacterioplanes sanyensis]|nr:hypothetical protein GCM10011297_01670 [Bacterioplanes sanyensis]